MAGHGRTRLIRNGPHWSAWQDTAGPTTRKSSSAVSALIGLSLTEEVISLGGNNNLLFTMYNVPNKYIQSARYEFRTTLSGLKERSLDGRTHNWLLRARVFLTDQHCNCPTAAAAWWQPLVKSAKKYKRCDHHKNWEAGEHFWVKLGNHPIARRSNLRSKGSNYSFELQCCNIWAVKSSCLSKFRIVCKICNAIEQICSVFCEE